MPLMLSALIAGLVGSATHCAVMCSTMVTVQMLDVQRDGKPMRHMGYYHLGRIGVYVLCAVMVQQAGSWFFTGQAEPYRRILLLGAGMLFFISALAPQATHRLHRCCAQPKRGLMMRGAVMGLMPCGMVLSMLMMVATVESAAYAALMMAIYGMATVPLLHVIGMGSVRMMRGRPKMNAWVGRVGLAMNGLLLTAMSMGI
jgi:uncharacterized protein